ncbi:MAG: hypothetical protein IT286_03935 [Proteobacteria bacterium]|jgi:uncharacterized coiled-coil protein SlyX|nr:hypothetical protein [Pseudomonadota bacterium]
MAFHKRHLALAFVAVVLCSSAWGQDLRGRIAQMESDFKSQETVIETLREDLTERTQEIEKIKRGQSGIVSKFLLQKKLREAQIVSKDLESLLKKHDRLLASLRTERSNLMTEVDTQIKTLTASKETHQGTQLQQLQSLIAEKEKLLSLQQRTMLRIPNFNLSSQNNNKDDLVEKLRVVEDLQKSMNQKIAMLKEEIEEEKSKEFLRNEVSHFIDEESFFGEQSFMSSGVNRREASRNINALALKREAGSDTTTTPVADVPGAQPTTPTDTTSPTVAAEPQIATVSQSTSESTSFQQPQEMGMFETLLGQVQDSIRDTSAPSTTKTKSDTAKTKPRFSKKTKRGAMETNLALSQKIVSDLEILRQNLNRQLQTLE